MKNKGGEGREKIGEVCSKEKVITDDRTRRKEFEQNN